MSAFRLLRSVVLFAILLAGFSANGQKIVEPAITDTTWTEDYTPFRIVGNLYYVGSYDLACYLITTPQGHILINTGVAGSESMIRRHVEALGFKFSDIKILLATHAHFDHVGAMAAIKKTTGAQMMVEAGDRQVLADGGNSDFVMGGKGSLFAPVVADRILHNGDTISLGGMHIVLLHHPGHTKGASSFLFNVADGHRTYRVLIANMPSVLDETRLSGMPGYANVGKDYAYTFNAMKDLHFDIWLASHASQFYLHKKHHEGEPYNPAAFIDNSGYHAALENLHKKYLEKLKNK